MRQFLQNVVIVMAQGLCFDVSSVGPISKEYINIKVKRQFVICICLKQL